MRRKMSAILNQSQSSLGRYHERRKERKGVIATMHWIKLNSMGFQTQGRFLFVISGLKHSTQKLWKKGTTKLKRRGKASKILLLLLLRRKLSVISDWNCKLRIFLVLKILFVVFLVISSQQKKYGGSGYMHVKHAALLKLKDPALFLIMHAACFRFNNAACFNNAVDLARLRLPDNFPATKKDRTCFSHTVSLYSFSLSIRWYNADRKQWVWMTISNYYQNRPVKYQNWNCILFTIFEKFFPYLLFTNI